MKKVYDPLTPQERSERMSRIRAKDTGPEKAVRRVVYEMGYRYRLHLADLPGKPDLVFIKRKKIIFVHGCFWHQHQKCKIYVQPKTKTEFWFEKLNSNVQRDKKHQRFLKKDGWAILVIWECQIKQIASLKKRIRRFLEK